MSGPYLDCKGLTRRFEPVIAVDGVDLGLERGKTLALLGPSGCGKTTLLRMIAGLDAPDAGSVTLAGRTLTGPGVLVPPDKRKVGMVFQDYALFPHMMVHANVAFGIKERHNRRQRVEALLDLVGLSGLGRRMPNELSGGQQQRVALARTLAAQPDLILLDEPFSNLDPTMRARVRAEVRQLIEALGSTAIFVTHDQEEALSLAQEIAVMLDGRIVQVGRPALVYTHPVSRQVAEFLGDANFFSGRRRNGHLEFELGLIAQGEGDDWVDVMVRPENLELSPECGQPVEVVTSEYYGHDQMVTVRLPSGTLVRVRLLPGRDLSPGQRLGLQMKGDVLVFPSPR